MSLLPNSNAIETGGYTIQRSLRFRSSASAYLNRTPSVASNRKTFTWSGWIKLSLLGQYGCNFAAGNNNFCLKLAGASGNTYQFEVYDYNGGFNFQLQSTATYRDPSSWYHLVVAVDTTQATASNRVKVYVNGSQVTSFTTANYPSQNFDTYVNSTVPHYHGAFGSSYLSSGYIFDGYMSEINFIDGQALAPSSFGETSTTTGAWIPKKYAGTYGTNGFYLPFTNTTSATTLCYDSSGNGNNWTPNNISTTAGATYDSMTDVPTLTSTSTANYCVLNPLKSWVAPSNANLKVVNPQVYGSRASFAVSSGKWYWEVYVEAASTWSLIGVLPATVALNVDAGYIYGSCSAYYAGNGYKVLNGYGTSYGASYSAGSTIGVALDCDSNSITFYKNGVSQGAFTLYTSAGTEVQPFVSDENNSSTTVSFNFGQQPFSYSAPSGYKQLNTFNLPTPTIKQGNLYMDATLYTGNGGTKTVTNDKGFQPGWVWTKSYTNSSQAHLLTDVIRGSGYAMYAQLNNAQSTRGCTLNSNGFSYVYPNEGGDGNYPGYGYVAYQWKSGSSTVSNTAGSITSQVSANTTAGFSVVGWTGTGVAGTVGHGLGVAPAMTIIKSYNAAQYWIIWHQSLPSYASDLYFNTNDPVQSDGQFTALPSSTVLSLAAGKSVNVSTYTYVAYCFAEITGYSKFGIYSGDGSMSDGPFIYTGFRPRWILIKALSGATYWEMFDVARNTYNVVDALLKVNTADAQLSSYPFLDVVSNGFKIRSAYGYQNDSGVNYIYAAFAENPFKYSNAR